MQEPQIKIKMYRVFPILICILFLGCNNKMLPKKTVEAKAVKCLRDFLDGEDSGGTWELVSEPAPSGISGLLVGDNPCIEWSNKPCGTYQLRYIVGDVCCRDTSYITPTKCCIVGTSSCN